MKISNFLEEFIADKRLEGRAESTIKEYRCRLGVIEKMLRELDIDIQHLTKADISAFVELLHKKYQNFSTKKIKFSIFCVFILWGVKKGYFDQVEIDKDLLPKSKAKKRIRRLTDEELKIFKSYLDTLQPNARTAFYLMLGTGCRVGEAAHLRPTDVSLRGRSVYVDIKDAKWGSDRCVPIVDQEVARIVWAYRQEISIDNRPLFRLSKRTLQGYATKFSKRTGIAFHCHLLRHTFAALLTERGVPMTTTQYLLGHKSIGMTAHYAASALTDLSDVLVEI